MKRFLKLGGILLLVAVAVFGIYKLRQVLTVGAGYYAKMLCSGVFVSGRPATDVIAKDVLADQSAALKIYFSEVDRADMSVDVWLPANFVWRKATYREGFGCHLSGDASAVARLRAPPPVQPPPAGVLWPNGQRIAPEQTLSEQGLRTLSAVIDDAFAESDPERLKRTRAIVVVHDGRIVAERYADGFRADTPQLGWSMAKSVTNAIAGALVSRDRIATDEPAPIKHWQADGDPRRQITLDNLLRMSSGLEFDENYAGQFSDVRVMLFLKTDKARFAAQKPLECDPGACWHYASGTSNIIASILQDVAAKDNPAIAHELLFEPVQMHTAVFEPDASGTLVGSSYVYASARDWARLGLLYLQRGVWNGERIFSANWLDYTLQPSPGSNGKFGAHVWLSPPSLIPGENVSEIPEDDFYFLGHDGQMVAVIPSRRTVIVRLGLTRKSGLFDHAKLVRRILAALPN